jgi:hypothetical protein
MKKWMLFIAVAILVVMGVLSSTLGLDPEFGLHDGFLFSFASGVNSVGRIIAVLIISILVVFACVVAISALADIFNKAKRE